MVQPVADAASSASSAVSSATKITLPTFTVCHGPMICKFAILCEAVLTQSSSQPRSRAISSSNSLTTGRRDGSHLMLRRTQRMPTRMRNGHMLVNGLLKNHMSSRVSRAIRVLSSRTLLLIMPFLPNSQRRSITRARLWLCNMRLSFRVSQSENASKIITVLIVYRWPRMRWCIFEASPRQQGASPGGILQHVSIRCHVRS